MSTPPIECQVTRLLDIITYVRLFVNSLETEDNFLLGNLNQEKSEVSITLASYVKEKMGAKSYREVEKATIDLTGSKVSRSTLNLIVSGSTYKPQPDTLAALALTFAEKDKAKTKQFYAEMMTICGYLDLLPDAQVKPPTPIVNEKEVLGALNDDLKRFANGLREKSLGDYWEFLRSFSSQTQEAKPHKNPQ